MTTGSTRTRPAPRVVATDVGFSEGPLYTPAGDTYFTSITHGRLYRLTDGGRQPAGRGEHGGRQPAEPAGRGEHGGRQPAEPAGRGEHGGAEVAAELGGGANGATLALDGSIYVAQNGARWSTTGPRWGKDSLGGVQVVRPDGSFDWVHRDPIAPNDLCFGPDGMLYVTDPTRAPFGADGRLWRIDTATEEAELLTSTSYFPNGIGFGLDDRLYVASTYDSRIVAYRLEDGRLVDEQTAVQMDVGHPDGFTFDADGNLIVCAIDLGQEPGRIQTWSVTGEKLDEYVPGDNPKYTNIVLDAAGKMTICDSEGGAVLVVDDWGSAGLELHPYR